MGCKCRESHGFYGTLKVGVFGTYILMSDYSLYLLVKLPELGIPPVHVPFLVSDPYKHLVDVVGLGATPSFDDRRNPHTHNTSKKGVNFTNINPIKINSLLLALVGSRWWWGLCPGYHGNLKPRLLDGVN